LALPSGWRSLVGFVGVWAFLDALFGVRLPPAGEPPAWWLWLVPSLDMTALLAAFAVAGWRGRRAPPWLLRGLGGALVLVPIFRLSAGVVYRNYYRPLNLTLDLPLLPELVRLLRSTVALPVLIVGALLTLAALVLLGALAGAALAHAQRCLATGPGPRWALAAGALAAAFSPLFLGTSVFPRVAEQARFALATAKLRREKAAAIAAVQQRLRGTPAAMEKLRGADVLVFFVESYGATVLREPRYRQKMLPAYQAFAGALAGRGFSMASRLLESPVYGGGSWLAHATLSTGVRIADGLEFALLRQTRPEPLTLAWFFRQAGYRTVLVQPGTTRRWPEGEVHGFDQKYYAPDLEYRGPKFGWAEMPDQYVLDLLHRREVAPARRPLFIEYALVSSHAPWHLQPPVVEDWSLLEGGGIYRRLPPRRFPVTWSRLHEGGEAFVASIVYDLEVLERYLTRVLARDALVFILGDHQPAGSITGQDPSLAVPVHVLSRERELVELFTARGWVPGMIPDGAGPAPGMETFLSDLLDRLSDGPLGYRSER
jgi:hypothetical protein